MRQPSLSGPIALIASVLLMGVPCPARGGQSTDASGAKLSVQDRLDIQELFARYSQALDMGNGDELAKNVFAPDGIFHDPSLCLVGSAELRAGLANHPSRARTSQHWPANIIVTEASGNQVKTRSYVIVFNAKGGMTMGTYHDTLVKSGGRWLIQHRQVWRPGAVKRDPRCPADLDALEP